MRFFISIRRMGGLSLALLSSLAMAGNRSDDVVDMGYRGVFMRSGGGFSCFIEKAQNVKKEDVAQFSDQWCLHMGGFAIGADADLLKPLGTPYQITPESDSAENRLFFLGKPEQEPYVIFTVARNHIVALQVTGGAPLRNWSFNGVALGDSTDALVKIFGQPLGVMPVDDGELWSYLPWEFSFVVSGGRVKSIRISTEDLA